MAGAGSTALEQRRGLVALGLLARRQLARHAGARLARIAGMIAAVGLAAWDVWALRESGSDIPFRALGAHAVEVSIWTGGWLLGWSVARSSPREEEATAALASMRGHGARAVQAARFLACVALAIETVVVPLAVFASILIAVSTPAPPGAGARRLGALLAAVLVGAGGAALLGALGGLCRRVSTARGRLLYVVLSFVPWLVAEALPGSSGAWSSLPGMVHRFTWAWIGHGGAG